MDEDRRAEIAELRRRVFGPAPASAADHAGALARLRELEGESRQDAAPETPAERVGPVPAPAPMSVDEDIGTDIDAGTGTDPGPRPATRRRPRRRIALPWAASLAVAVVASVGATAWALDDDRATVSVLDLALLPAPDNATYLSVDTGSVIPGTAVADFHGVTVARVPAAPGDAADPASWTVPAPDQPGDACLTVGASNPDGSVDGPSGCGAGSVPARVAVVVAEDSPEELRAAYPVGTTLLFEDEGGPVRVRVAGR